MKGVGFPSVYVPTDSLPEPDRWADRVKLVEKRAEIARLVLEGVLEHQLDLDHRSHVDQPDRRIGDVAEVAHCGTLLDAEQDRRGDRRRFLRHDPRDDEAAFMPELFDRAGVRLRFGGVITLDVAVPEDDPAAGVGLHELRQSELESLGLVAHAIHDVVGHRDR